MVEFCIYFGCALLAVIFLELRACRAVLLEIKAEILVANQSARSVTDNSETIIRRLDEILVPARAKGAAAFEDEIRNEFAKIKS